MAPATLAAPAAPPARYGGGMCGAGVAETFAPGDANPWRSRLYERLRGRAYPLLVDDETGTVAPAAALWAGARLWTRALRDAGLVAGDRIVLAAADPAGFVQTLVAALWEGLTILPAPAPTDSAALASLLSDADARAVVLDDGALLSPHALYADRCQGPAPTAPGFRLRGTRHAPTPDLRFLLRTSGTSGEGGRLVALSDGNVLSCLDAHLPALGLEEEASRVLSVLPWSHAFGLVLDLLAGLLSGAEIVRRGPASLADPDALIAAGRACGATHLNAVPLALRRIAARPDGPAFLRSLEGGVVGGAPVDGPLAALLSTTRLRAGYGMTEAGPGVCLGRPGEWPDAGWLGRPLGCGTAFDSEGVLFFAGPNAFPGYWTADAGLTPRLPDPDGWDDWVRTGDVVTPGPGGDGYCFVGRADDDFKLANGRRVRAAACEAAIRARCAGVTEALLYTRDGETLEAAVSLAPGASLPSPAAVADALGPLGARLTAVRPVGDDFWVRTVKGTRRRRACLAKLGVTGC